MTSLLEQFEPGPFNSRLLVFQHLQEQILAELDRDPAAAIAWIESVDDPRFGLENLLALRAIVYVEGGQALRYPKIVMQGIEILEHLGTHSPDEPNIMYNLANGLTVATDLEPYEDRGWYLKTLALRHRAKKLYERCAEASATGDLPARAQTNLGNALLKAFRFAEAYEYYCRALRSDYTNTIAATGAARILVSYADAGIGDKQSLMTAANEHLRYARQNPARLRELAGERAFEELMPLLQRNLSDIRPHEYPEITPYQQFVRDHRLALSATMDGADVSIKRWDSLTLPGIYRPSSEHYQIPAVFATFNALKADFLAARHLAFEAIHAPPPESGKYADTLDYANYGVEAASLTLAQRACVDVLDKLAAALLHYLGETKPERNASFINSFFTHGAETVDWKPIIRREIEGGNRGVLALAEMADDAAQEGYLQPKRQLRNASTHRVVILHDFTRIETNDAEIIERYDADEFRHHLIETLQLVRAALIYFVGAVADHEGTMPTACVGTLDVPDHDWVRGRN